MFALNRMSIATNNRKYNDWAITLAKAIHPKFVYNRATDRPKIHWKMSIDLTYALTPSEVEKNIAMKYMLKYLFL